MSNYLDRIQLPILFPSVDRGVFIVGLHVDKIPPHVGIVVDGHYFSLKVHTKDVDVLFSSLEVVIKRKKIPTLLVEIQPSIALSQVRNIFENYGSAILPGDSCMSPLLGMLRMPQSYLLDDVLTALEQSGQVKEVYGMYLPTSYEGIPSYSNADVQQRINSLRYVKR